MKIRILIVILSFILFGNYVLAEAQKPYKIGAIMPITGPASFLGTPAKETVQMLLERINDSGGINGHPVEVSFNDDMGDPSKAVLIVNRLMVDREIPVIIGPQLSSNTLAVIPIIEKAEIPLVSCASSIQITQPVRKWVFKVTPGDDIVAGKIYNNLKKLKFKKIAILTSSDGFGDSSHEQLLKKVGNYGFEIVADEKYNDKDSDMTSQLTRIRGTGAQVLVVCGTGPGTALIARNFRQLGMEASMPQFHSHGSATPKFLELAGEAADGVKMPALKILKPELLSVNDPQKKLLLTYKKEYEEKFKKTVSPFGANGWDSFTLAVEALKAVGPDRQKIRDFIENKKNFIGIAGIFNFSPQDHNGLDAETALMFVEVKKGQWILYESGS